jgi:hypothetical protein
VAGDGDSANAVGAVDRQFLCVADPGTGLDGTLLTVGGVAETVNV